MYEDFNLSTWFPLFVNKRRAIKPPTMLLFFTTCHYVFDDLNLSHYGDIFLRVPKIYPCATHQSPIDSSAVMAKTPAQNTGAQIEHQFHITMFQEQPITSPCRKHPNQSNNGRDMHFYNFYTMRYDHNISYYLIGCSNNFDMHIID